MHSWSLSPEGDSVVSSTHQTMDSGGLCGGVHAPSTSSGFTLTHNSLSYFPEGEPWLQRLVYMRWKAWLQEKGKAGLLFLTRSLLPVRTEHSSGLGVGEEKFLSLLVSLNSEAQHTLHKRTSEDGRTWQKAQVDAGFLLSPSLLATQKRSH